MTAPERGWSRHSYPVQTSHNNDTWGAQGDEEVFEEAQESQQRRLPRTIRAVKDSDHYHHKGRTLIICLDGTGDKFDADNSNIVHLVSCLKKDNPDQVTYYQSGIGTYDGGGLSNGLSAAADMAVGSGLGVHIQDAYKFLMSTYHEGDKICLFGFSRGAYTARCLAGMLHKVGLLPAHNVAQVPFAYQFYKDDSKPGWKMSEDFKKTFCIDVNVYFLGVFDCVASVGFIPRKLPLSSTPTSKCGFFRHAMALDEHRAKFKISRWSKTTSKGQREIEARAIGNDTHPTGTGNDVRKNLNNKNSSVKQTAEARTSGKVTSQKSTGDVVRNVSAKAKPRRSGETQTTANSAAPTSNGGIGRNLSQRVNSKQSSETRRPNSSGVNGGRPLSSGVTSGRPQSSVVSGGTTQGEKEDESKHGHFMRSLSTRVKARHYGISETETKEMLHGKKGGSQQLSSDPETRIRQAQAKNLRDTDVLEVWFMGAHADVGGGAVKNEERHKLSQIPLRWMIRQCFECDTGILFSVAALAEMGLDVHTLYPTYQRLPRPVVGPSPTMMEKWEQGKLHPIKNRSSHYDTVAEEKEEKKDGFDHIRFAEHLKDGTTLPPTGDWIPEQCEDYFDAMAPVNDQLVIAKGWWVLEIWPIKVKIQPSSSDDWHKKIRGNLGRFRPVQDTDPKLHWTVRQRMHEKGYKVRTRIDKNAAWETVV